MWSDDKPKPHSAPTVAADLDAALTAAGEAPPYVMVGHSLGGPYIMAYTKRFSDKVAGLVFVDASHPDQVARLAKAIGKELEAPLGGAKALAAFAWTGLPRLLLPAENTPAVPEAARLAAAAYAPTSLGPMLAESDGMEETMADAGAFRTLGDRPLVVLTAMKAIDSATLATIGLSSEQGRKFQAEWLILHNEEASWSSASEHQVLPDATHYIQRDRPDVVIAAVRHVVARLRHPADSAGQP
jgi:pimeloyl-ACP methyl ester carboxylesterase